MFHHDKTFNRIHGTVLSFAFALITIITIQPVQAKTLEGQINMEEYLKNQTGPGLNRKNIKQLGDPFNASSAPAAAPDQFDAPVGAFESQQLLMAPPPPQQQFNLNAYDQGDGFGGQQGIPVPIPIPMPDRMPQQAIQARAIPQNMLPAIQSQDPDMSDQMQLQWDLWHRRVAEDIFKRFDAIAQKNFANTKPIACEAAYTVTCNGQIRDVRLLRKSDNFMFNAMLMGVLNSMSGNPVLQFPPGTRRQMVMKTGTFSRNCGVNGFKHTTNDNESIGRSMQ